MISKVSVIDQIQITENNIILVRTATRIIEDGQIIAQTYHRTSYEPGSDISKADEKVKKIAKILWEK